MGENYRKFYNQPGNVTFFEQSMELGHTSCRRCSTVETSDDCGVYCICFHVTLSTALIKEIMLAQVSFIV